MPMSAVYPIGLSFLAALLLTWAAVRRLRAIAPRLGFIDVPNRRSSHTAPTPRAGGAAFVVAVPLLVLVASGWMGLPLLPGEAALLVASLVVAAVGLADDRRGLPVRVRFSTHLLAAGILVLGGGWLHELQWPGGPSIYLGWLGVPATLFWLVGLTNGYNFMDGIDGIAGAQAVVAGAAAGLLALAQAELPIALYCWVVAGGALGFLTHNLPPARIFMGDVGSAFLGFTFAGLAVLSNEAGGRPVPWAVWAVLLAPFLFDTTLTLALRVARGERWYEAHRQHLYQRLVRAGWSHGRVTSVYLGADLFLAGLALAWLRLGLDGIGLALAAVLPLVGILSLVKWVEWRPAAGAPSPPGGGVGQPSGRSSG
jgi:UDP-N-acetylmuramyl pentapeptide phosphotransferase/UDP-N-acetylglucosamine-1-phosphate transferase